MARFGIAHARFAPGESVLVCGAADSIGIMTVQLAVRGGTSAVAVTTSSAERGDRLRKLGATHVLDRAGEGGGRSPGLRPHHRHRRRCRHAFFLRQAQPERPHGGRGRSCGLPAGGLRHEMMAAFQKSLSFATFSTDTVPQPDRRAVRTEQFEAASRGELQMVVHELLPLEQAVLAHQKMEAGEVFGSIVLVPSGS